jgi:hypothetical protein
MGEEKGVKMNYELAKAYLAELETTVIIPAITGGDVGKVSVAATGVGKLSMSPFAAFIGLVLPTEDVVVVDYYGLQKKSHGFLQKSTDTRKGSGNAVQAKVFHFASLRLAHIEKYNRDLLDRFMEFKSFLLKQRGFKAE